MGAQWRKAPAESDRASVADRAHDNLAYIRSAMASSTSFTGVPGLGMIAMGAIALAGGYIATRQFYWESWLWCWTAVAFLGCATGVAAMLFKARVHKKSLWEGSARRFLLNFSPAIIAGAVLGQAYYLVRTPTYDLTGDLFMPALWQMLYGAAVISGGAFSVRPVSIMGVCFMVTGALTLLLPTGPMSPNSFAQPYDIALAVSFGGFHIVFGALIAVRHGG